MEYLEDLQRIYQETATETMRSLEKILIEELGINNNEIKKGLEEIINKSVENLISKWSTERKYIRTLFVRKILPGYPLKVIKLSLSLDCIINILDELLDEKLEEELKTLYITELIRVLSIHHYQDLNKPVRARIANYFNKIVSIAVLETLYKNLIEKERDFNKITIFAKQIYDCRSLDIDIYFEITLLEIFGEKERDKIYNIVKAGRKFRALNLIKKDIIDIDHDKKQNTQTAMTIIKEKDNSFKDYVNELIKHYDMSNEEIDDEKIKKQLKIMINEEKKAIKELLVSL